MMQMVLRQVIVPVYVPMAMPMWLPRGSQPCSVTRVGDAVRITYLAPQGADPAPMAEYMLYARHPDGAAYALPGDVRHLGCITLDAADSSPYGVVEILYQTPVAEVEAW